MHILANSCVMRLSDHSRVVGFLAIFAYPIDMSKIDCGAIPCSLLKLHILRRFLYLILRLLQPIRVTNFLYGNSI